MILRCIAFSERGFALAKKIAVKFGGIAFRCENIGLSEFSENGFCEASALVFVGAAGIAVRAVAPYIKHKSEDPAVICVDELGNYAIPLLSGHLGGANALAKKIAEEIGAQPVITTATDINKKFAVDEWARIQGFKIENPEKIKSVSAKLLSGENVYYKSEIEIAVNSPEGIYLSNGGDCDFYIGFETAPKDALHIIPSDCVIGIGCKKGTPEATIEGVFADFLKDRKISEKMIYAASSIDLKENEEGLLSFCKKHRFPISFYSANELNEAKGSFSGSEFVDKITGTDNVCERSAVLLSGGILLEKKYAENGVTMALAKKASAPDWRTER